MLINLKYAQCPHCQKWYSTTELMSYTTFGNAECWSDGKCINTNFSEYSFLPFSKCDICNNFFWLNDCKQLEDYEIREYIKENENTEQNEKTVQNKENSKKKKLIIDFLRENHENYISGNGLSSNYPPPIYWENLPEYFIPDFLQIIENKENLSTENEIYIRVKLWQHINDLIRYSRYKIHKIKSLHDFKIMFNQIKREKRDKKIYQKYNTIRTENMKQLSELLQNNNKPTIDDTVLILELERQLGHFEKAKEIINNADASDIQYHSSFIKMSEKLISKKSTKLFKM